MPEIPFRSARQLASLIRQKKVGCLELLDLYLARVERYNPKINAIIFLDAEGARRRAREADRALARGHLWGPLHGVPMTIKESFNVAGMPTTWGLPHYKNHYPQKNAVVVDRYIQSGVVLFGKTNVPMNLADWQTFNEVYGTTNNPWDVTRVPGGSSGGSAAALAAGLAGIETGSDIGGSIRNPAHYCGVYGHKPTYGMVTALSQGLHDEVAPADITVIGPIARSADDLLIGLNVMAGPDDIDGRGWRLRLPKPPKKTLREYKIAAVFTDPQAEVDGEVQKRLCAVVDFLRKSKAKVKDDARPAIDSHEVFRNYIYLLRAETVKRLPPEIYREHLAAVKTLDPNDDSYPAETIRGHTLYHKDWLTFNEARHKMRRAWEEFFREYDLLLCPAAATAAFPHNQKGERWERMVMVNGKPQPSTTQMFWAGYPCNFYLPSTIAPAGLTRDGLPVGIQIVGPQYGDYTCIHFARLLEREFLGFMPPPGFD